MLPNIIRGNDMTWFTCFRLKNAMLLANLISNMIGVSVTLFINRSIFSAAEEMRELAHSFDLIFLPASFMVPFIVTLIYEQPIRRFLNEVYQDRGTPEDAIAKVHQRLLNEPFFLIALDMGIWLSAAVLYPLFFWVSGAECVIIFRPFFMSLFTGLITVIIAFFVFEHLLQKRLAPFFFPDGGIYMIPKTIRIRIRTRLAAFLFAINVVPFLAILILLRETVVVNADPAMLLDVLRTGIFTSSIIFLAVGIWLTYLVSANLTEPLREIIRVLKGVRNGNFDNKVRVRSNDEIGYTGDVINEMNEGLKEREFILDTFGKYVTQEVRDEILSGRIPLDGEMKDVTILFADLRDFTPMTESHDPKLVGKIMNNYFETMADVIQQEGGLVLQFLGDEIYAVFGAPISRADHPERAYRAATTMNQRLIGLNEIFVERGWPPLKHGIGIHTGEAVAANIGSPDRLSYLLVGDTVNLASRLQGLTKKIEENIIISQATRQRLHKDLQLKKLEAAKVAGKSQPVEIFAVA